MMKAFDIIISICIFLIIASGLYADTILLSDGTYLVGKVIEWDSRHIIFKNAHGAFAIRKNQLVKLYVTDSQNEDIVLRDKLGHAIKDEDIIRHYLAGAESVPEGGLDKDEIESAITSETLSRQFRVSLSYYYTLGKLSDAIPSAYGIGMGYTRSLSPFLPDEAAFWAPDINIEPEIVLFSGDDSEVRNYSCYAGPVWRFRYPGRIKSFATLQFMPGISYLIIEGADYSTTSITSSFKISAGYEFPFRDFLVSVNLSYLYIYDKEIPLQGIGVTVSGSYKF